MKKNADKGQGWQKIDVIFNKKKAIRPPAFEWQDLALKLIDELGVPGYKRSAIFQICRDYPKNIIEQALIDTKELCQTGLKWKYFFKIIGNNIEWDK